ncbi:hypothetical protein [Mucilaginibacter sp. SJ]|uniref:hypothetical protein n=1 Tax=Mucilaginibacter sp. SJ TaxID=3029053 RepID=UPI0023A96856|nr:hypothetical protein [Mucilaginibacter sp. SJ]WEA02044.1 hypothetical protein MusilaSJ_03785 [Mucilaginibacter sp. SJ]
MIVDPLSVSIFEMRLEEIHHRDPMLRYEISIRDFIALFPLRIKNGRPLKPEQPSSFALDRDVFLQVLVAFNQSFN